MKNGFRTIGVYPAGELQHRHVLFEALEDAFPVRFVALEAIDGERCDAEIHFTEDVDADRTRGSRKTLMLRLPQEPQAKAVPSVVRFGDSKFLDSRLRSRVLTEDRGPIATLGAEASCAILGHTDGRPVWIKRHTGTRQQDIAATAPAQLTEGEVLRDHLAAGRFLGLLPVVHFLREVTAGNTWEPAPPRASFLIDDPNLHWKTYGYLDYAELARQAEELSYHVAIATVPIDLWYAHPATVELLKRKSRYVSLTLHGNNHSKRELGPAKDLAHLRRGLAQALRRASAFEQRTGLAISRVMVPPHEECSEDALRALAQLRYDAVSMTRPYSSLPFEAGASPRAHPNGTRSLTGWYPAELTRSGVPVLVRRVLWNHDEIVLRSFLDHPLVLYGHVSELADGLGLLEDAAATVNAQPGVCWCSLTDISRSNFELRREADRLTIRPFSRHICVPIRGAISEVRLELDPPLNEMQLYARILDDAGVKQLRLVEERTVKVDMSDGDEGAVEIVVIPSDDVDPATVPDPRWQSGPLARRILVEAKDRLVPHVARLRRSLHTPAHRCAKGS